MDQPAFQDLISDNHCWGCGNLNDDGLRIKSRWTGDEAVCTWQPHLSHAAGPQHILNGGIIATVIDCHSVCTAIADAYRAEGRQIGSDPQIWCATASLQLTYLRPTPISEPVTLKARIKDRNERRTTVLCSLYSGDQECARAELVAIRVPSSWRDAPRMAARSDP